MWKSITGRTHSRIRVQNGDMAFILPHRTTDIVTRNACTVQDAIGLQAKLEEAERESMSFRVRVSWRTRFTGWISMDLYGRNLWVKDGEITRE